MTKGEILSAAEAAAFGAKLSGVEAMPYFPMLSTNRLADKFSSINDCLFELESQSSAITSAIATESCGKRVFTAISGIQSIQDFSIAANMRLPIVAVNVGSYNHDVLALRDKGWLIFMADSNQEIIDSIIQAYKIAEDNKVLLPVMINIDDPDFREPVVIPTDQSIRGFLPKFRLDNKIDIKKPIALGITDDLETKAQQQKAMENALERIKKIDEKWKKKFKRSYGLAEEYLLEDAECVIVTAGGNSSTAKSAVNKLRNDGEKVGLLRLRVIRPWSGLENILANKRVAVIDQSLAPGSGGILYNELRGYSGFCSSFISSRIMGEDDFFKLYKELKSMEKPERFWFV